MFGQFCGLDEAHILSVSRHDYRVVLSLFDPPWSFLMLLFWGTVCGQQPQLTVRQLLYFLVDRRPILGNLRLSKYWPKVSLMALALLER